MRTVLTSLALSCAFVAALGVAASACEWHDKQATAAADSAQQTAQTEAPSAKN